MKLFAARLLTLISILLLSACSIQPPVTNTVTNTVHSHAIWQERQALLNKLDNWSINGRIAITVGEEGWNAGLQWKQQQQRYKLQIFAPLGQGTISLQGDAGMVIMRSTNLYTPPSIATNAEKLLYDQLGWHMPVDSLRHWVTGIPDPDIAFSKTDIDLDAEGRLIRLKQSGWNVNFLRYRRVQGNYMPDKIFIEKKDISVRLVIQGWKISQI